MTPEEFTFAAGLIHARSGFVMTRDKIYLMEGRLMPVVRRHTMRSVGELIAAVQADETRLGPEIVDAMMAKDTGFFRDWKPFVHFRRTVLPKLQALRPGKQALRVLCAGTSTGQEAYSVALAVRDQAAVLAGRHVDIVGIDISATAVAAAARGAYSQFDIQRGLPAATLARDFTRQDGLWILDDAVRAMVEFKTWNLLDELFPLGRFEVIFCRNVLVSFDLQTKLATLRKLARLLTDDGLLYLGAGETITGMSDGLRCVDGPLAIFARFEAQTTLAD